MRWLSRGRTLLCFISLLSEVKAFLELKEEDITLLSDAEWLLDNAFLTDVTEKLKDLNLQLQGKDKNIYDMISAVKAFKTKLIFLHSASEKQRISALPLSRKNVGEPCRCR